MILQRTSLSYRTSTAATVPQSHRDVRQLCKVKGDHGYRHCHLVHRPTVDCNYETGGGI